MIAGKSHQLHIFSHTNPLLVQAVFDGFISQFRVIIVATQVAQEDIAQVGRIDTCQIFGRVSIVHMAVIGENTPFEMRWIGSVLKHGLVVVRLDDQIVGLPQILVDRGSNSPQVGSKGKMQVAVGDEEVVRYCEYLRDVCAKYTQDETVRRKAEEMGAGFRHYYVYAPDEVLRQRLRGREGTIAARNLENFDELKALFEAPDTDERFILINGCQMER